MGTGQNFFYPRQVNFLLLELGWVRSAIFSLGLDLENFPKTPKLFNFFSSGQKYLKGSGQKLPG